MGTPYMGELRIMSFNYAPKYWAQCAGQTCRSNRTRRCSRCWAPPTAATGSPPSPADLRTLVPGHMGAGYVLGETMGEYSHTLLQTEIPQHMHFLKADATAAGDTNSASPAAGNSFGQTTASPAGRRPYRSTCTAPP
jgi:microcystin-dependent protein